uniref:anaerobic sulfatase maturase n=1 Tax=Thaumasiovibrio occultus TaxID=1891184 RepID=UPI000B351DD9|nr:anaerobic sulfatase maturase [Thaumasiovibrio occultus]
MTLQTHALPQNTTPSHCHVMAKPTGSICNIDCQYCFYLEKEKLYPDRNHNWRMSDDTLERYIEQHIAAQAGNYVQFAWQGGEPTLMGLAFFENVMALCEKYRNGKTIEHAFQTNGILINDEWCAFFKRHNILVGVSIDGPADLHDHYRVTRSGKPTHAKVMAAIALLKQHQVEFNTLTVVNKENAKHPERVYQFLTDIGSSYLQFIPLVEREAHCHDESELKLVLPGESLAKVTEWSVPSWQYGEFLNRIFDYWVRRDVGRVFVNMFDSTLSAWCGHPPGLCVYSETCGHAFALEANGDLYNCDHYVYPEHKLGNIHDTTIKAMNESDMAIAFGQAKKTTLSQDCVHCEFKPACNGGCPKHRFAIAKSGQPNHNYFCQGYHHFFTHTAPYMAAMRDLLNQGRPATEVMMMVRQQDAMRAQAKRAAAHTTSNKAASKGQKTGHSVGRNDPCLCGSGKKFKRCCG